MIAVSAHNAGFACTISMILRENSSKRSQRESTGCASTNPEGLTNDTAGSAPAVGEKPRTEVVDQVVLARITAVERAVRQRREVIADRRDSRLREIGAVDVRTCVIAVVRVAVVRTAARIRILDEIRAGHAR